MIELKKGDAIPDGATTIKHIGDNVFVYFADDPEEIEYRLKRAKEVMVRDVLDNYALTLKQEFKSGNSMYSSDVDDIQDLMTAVATGSPQDFKTFKGQFKSHTPQQLKSVLADHYSHKIDAIKKRDMLIERIQAATTDDEANALTWDN
jgi:hypothetical protein